MKSAKRIPPADSHIWSLADQILVSGSNFLTGIVLARTLGIEAFGAYVVAQMYLLYANTFQASLVVSPMMTAVPAQHDKIEQQRLIRGFMGYTLLVLLITLLGVLGLAWLLGQVSPHLGIRKLALPLAVAMAAFQIQDWIRRALYVQTKNRQVFFSDAIAYGGQLGILVWLSLRAALNVDAALWTMAAAFSLSALFTLVNARLWPDLAAAVQVVKTYSRASRDYFASWQLQWLGSQGVILLGTGMVGPQAAGAIRAAQNLLGPVNVLFQWMDNIIPVRSALRLRDAGRAALVAYLGRIAWIGVLALSLFALVLMLVDEPLIVFLYGEEYRPFAILVVLQALYYLFGHGYRMVAYFHRALGNTRVLAHASFWWAVVAVAFAFLTVHWLADRGIMFALVAGEVAALTYLLWPRDRAAMAGERERHPAYLMLRRGNGSPYLILPQANKRLMYSALSMYYPSRWTGRLYRLSLARTLPWRARLGWVEPVHALDAWCPDLGRVLAAVPDAVPENVGVLIGAPGPCSKLTLKIMGADGATLAYARVAQLPDAVEKLRNEHAVLSALAATSVGPRAPRLIAHGELADSGVFFLVESAGPDDTIPHSLGPAHFAFLAGLVGEGRLNWTAVVDQVETETRPLRSDPDLGPVIASALATLRATPGPELRTCIEHGDFAPWNIRAGGSMADVFVLDWEHARLEGVPWLDALHFCFQNEALVGRRSPGQVLASLLSVFSQPAAREYARQLPMKAGHERSLIVLYVLRVLAVGANEGHAADAHQQVMRCRMLEHLLQSQAQAAG